MTQHELGNMHIRTVVAGSGAAGFGAALRLLRQGERDLAILTENVNGGTSRNTGSDKQTYYKISLAGEEGDSVLSLAQDLFEGQCVDGDLALCEAALSARCFYQLVESGVPFPCSEYGEYIGYKTDHDKRKRATSAGPYTSRIMTECLERQVRENQILVLDKLQLIRLLVWKEKIRGVLCLDRRKTDGFSYVIIWCENLILATGGPAGMYKDCVYPPSQLGSSGIALEAGIKGKNLTEWQFGMASLKPRWNVSGTYMQALPKFVSTDARGKGGREFLLDYFEEPAKMMSFIFLKGYQWPFDAEKIFGGSSVIDLLVYQETILKGRRVFLDFRRNTGNCPINFADLSKEACGYLDNAGACFGTPIERLVHMNEPAVRFYQEHGVDLYQEMLEIAVCAQHNNGGLAVDDGWETNIGGVFAIGEVSGTHGVARPGGTALNAGQVGAFRVAERIAGLCESRNRGGDEEKESLSQQAMDRIRLLEECHGTVSAGELWKKAAERMSRYGGMIRDEKGLEKALEETEKELASFTGLVARPKPGQAGLFYHLYDMLVAQRVYLRAMLDYIREGGGSRGSCLYTCPDGDKPGEKMPELYRCRLDKGAHGGRVQEVQLKGGECEVTWRPVRPLPETDYCFETQWKSFRERSIGHHLSEEEGKEQHCEKDRDRHDRKRFQRQTPWGGIQGDSGSGDCSGGSGLCG